MNATPSRLFHAIVLLAGTLLPAASQAAPQTGAVEGTEAEAKMKASFTTAQLEQIVAPIALYPDTVLAQVMMGATYPLEIVEAARWLQKNASVKGKALEQALKAEDWDPSVKALCGFPDVLKRMNENLDWTQDLGDAFLGQKKELFDAVQTMRAKALEAGELKTTEHQKVTQQEDKIIVVESTNPEVIYVPTYSPTVVYGPGWYYPTWYYPPMYAPPPPGGGFIAFGIGVAWGAAVWGDCDWHHGDIDIDIDHHNNFVKNTNVDASKYQLDKRSGNKGTWNHDPSHRKGVNYKSPQTAQQYGAGSGASRVTKDQARGFDRSATQGGNRPGGTATRTGAAPATRETAPRPPAGAAAHGGRGSDAAAGGTSRPSGQPSRAAGRQDSALSGSRSPGLDQAGSARGAASRGGGGMRGGGGRRR